MNSRRFMASSSFDHLVGAQQDPSRQLDADRSGGLEVDQNSNFVACSTGKSPAFAPLGILAT